MNRGQTYRSHLERIFRAGLRSVDPYEMIAGRLSVDGSRLSITTESGVHDVDLARFNRVFLVGAGKAGATMARAVEDVLGDRLSGGLVVVKYGHTDRVERIELVEARHPIPDERGIEAGRRIVELVREADEGALVLTVFSGGGSALLASPYSDADRALTLEDLMATNDALLACGAPIQEMNCVRKHISAVKGGRLAEAMYPATSVNLILSDVVGDALDAIASGPTAPDPTTYGDALSMVESYGLAGSLPDAVLALLDDGAAGRVSETPKSDDRVFERCTNALVGSNFAALAAARDEAADLGYTTLLLSSQVTGEAREIAKFFAALAKDQVRRAVLGKGPVCIVAGGETTVTLRGGGLGGRCQELALSFLVETSEAETANGCYFLSASTDGNDGPTDAAGAFVTPSVRRAATGNPAEYLSRNDSYRYFDSSQGLLRTGPTNTNVCDIQLLIVP